MNAKYLGCQGSGKFRREPCGLEGTRPSSWGGGGTEFESWPEQGVRKAQKRRETPRKTLALSTGGEINFGGEIEGQGG